MANDSVLVTGIHRKELGFGDRVAALIDPTLVDVMRIPQGISQARKGPREEFYSRAQHNEIYLQLFQQVKDRYRLMIDLHRGLDETGRCADVFCHDKVLLRCLGTKVQNLSSEHDIHLIRIASPGNQGTQSNGSSITDAEARTWIPPKIWLSLSPLYVGLEVYLTEDSDGNEDDWKFARLLIEEIRACAPGAPRH